MAITHVKNYSQPPYHDDFDENKNYQRILFKPGFAVQARELTQLQTALQAQVDKLGQYSFKDGDRVLNGKLSLNVDYKFVKVVNINALDINIFKGQLVTGAVSGIEAEVIDVVDADGLDPITFYVKYITSGEDATDVNDVLSVQTLEQGEEFSFDLEGITQTIRVGQPGDANMTGDITGAGSEVSISEGVYFISGNMVHVPSSSLMLEKYSNIPSYIVGLKITESIVDSGTTGHSNLLDNATGTSNETAPGADRYTIGTELIKQLNDLSARDADNYIHLATITNGEVIKKADAAEPIQTELASRFESRTFEESGDYVLNPFVLDIKEYLNDGENDGFLTADQIVDGEGFTGGDATTTAETFGNNRFAIGVEPSVAYINGFRAEKTETEHVTVEKPRGADDVAFNADFSLGLGYGNYVIITKSSAVNLPDILRFEKINLTTAAAGGGSVIGTARVRDFTDVGSTFRLHLFDIKINSGQQFANVEGVGQSGSGNFRATLDIQGQIYGSDQSILVYPLPADGVKSLKVDDVNNNPVDSVDVSFFRKGYAFTVTGGTGTANVNLGGDVTLASTDNVMISKIDGTVIADPENNLASGTTAGQSQVSLESLPGNGDYEIILSVQPASINNRAKSKTYVPSTTLAFDATVNDFDQNKPIYLGKADIDEIISIIDPSGNDVSDRFILDNGQRDSYYDIGRLIKRGNASIDTSTSGNHTITFSHWSHSATSTGNYYSVDSYADYENIGTYDGISLRDSLDFRPTIGYKTDGTGGAGQLGAIPAGNVSGEFNDTDASLPDDGILGPTSGSTLSMSQYMSRIDKLFLSADGEYKVIKGVSSRFPVEPENINDAIHLYTIFLNPYVFGVQDIVVEPEEHRRYTMRDIGELDARLKNLEYYTSLSLLEDSASKSQITDTGTLDGRFNNGFLVDGFFGHNVADTSHPDYAVAIDKENGILRPQFDERNVNLVREAADADRASTMGRAFYPSLHGEDSIHRLYVSKRAGIATLPYHNKVEINQPYSSYAEFVNPYNVVVWDGVVDLDPESDEWKEVNQRPDVIINDDSQYDQFALMAKNTGILGTVWNEWETHWTGRKTTKSAKRYTANARTPGRGVTGRGWWRRRRRGRSHIERLTGTINRRNRARAVVQKTTTVTKTTTVLRKTGIQTTLGHNIQRKSLGNRLIETNFIPFMRSRRVFFKAELLKPNTRVYAFFNDVNVTAYCQDLTTAANASNGWPLSADSATTQDMTGADSLHHDDNGTWPTGHTSYAKRSRANRTFRRAQPQNFTTTGGTFNYLKTDQYGRLYGEFFVPNNSSLRFKCGTRLFKLTDHANNNDDLAETTASENYHAKGILETYQRTIVNTKIPKIVRREVSRKRVITRTRTKVKHQLIKYYDPIAETFAISTKGGIFTTGVSLFFQQKDTRIPINVSIREVENGYPTQRVVPGCDKILYPSGVNIPTGDSAAANNGIGDASAETMIRWDHPVHLKEGAEYAIVCISNSDRYKVYVAETSKNDLTTPSYRITKQPYNGVFFTSANASTWTAEQNKDLKFKLHRAKYPVNRDHQLLLVNDELDTVKTEIAEPFEIVTSTPYVSAGSPGTTRIRIHQPNHGMYNTPAASSNAITEASDHKVTISNSNGVAGIPASVINGTHDVYETEIDSYVITVARGVTNSSSIGNRFRGSAAGEGNEVEFTENQHYDLLRLNTSLIEFPETFAQFSHLGYSAASPDSTSLTNYTVDPAYTEIIPNSNTDMDDPKLIQSTANHISNRTDTAFIKGIFRTEVDNLTPVVDLNRTSLFTIQNRINDPATRFDWYNTRGTAVGATAADIDTATDGNNSVCNYVTKEVTIDNLADGLDMYLNVNRPTGSSIDVYYKISSDVEESFDEVSWTKAPTEDGEEIPFDDEFIYGEVHYQIQNVPDFAKFQVKIVLRSTNSSYVPTCKDFRAIATT